jgi:hypothetical protein
MSKDEGRDTRGEASPTSWEGLDIYSNHEGPELISLKLRSGQTTDRISLDEPGL